jgi:radical SAM superfamily enzyme YgiQ (UPF0313 family)
VKVVLIQPMTPKYNFDDTNDQLPPYGLMCLAAYLRGRHEVRIVDAELVKASGAEALAPLAEAPDLIGIGGTTPQSGELAAIAEAARRKFPRALVVAGGTHATIVQKELLDRCPALDAVVAGPGEQPLLALADGQPPARIRGVRTRQSAEVDLAELPCGGDLDRLPLPARDLLPLHHYSGATHRQFTQTLFMATRGCPFDCTFCSNSLWGRHWRHCGVDRCLQELSITRDLGFEEVFLADDTMNVDPSWTAELLEAIARARLGLRLRMCFRANRKLLPESLMEQARRAGVRHIFFGVESGNEEVRQGAGKSLIGEDIRRAVALARANGIRTLCSFIVGLPGETSQTVQQSIDFAIRLGCEDAGFCAATPFPGTRLRQWALEKGFLQEPDYARYTMNRAVMRTEAMTAGQIQEAVDRANQDFYRRRWPRWRIWRWRENIIRAEYDSCRSVLPQALLRGDEVEAAIVRARLGRLCTLLGLHGQAVGHLRKAVEAEGLNDYDRAKALLCLARSHRLSGDSADARQCVARAAPLARPAHQQWLTQERIALGMK